VTTTRGAEQAAAAEQQGLAAATWRALGTSVQLVVTEPARLAAARAAVESVLDEVDAAASRFRADSELSRLRHGEWTPVSPVLHQYLRAALDAAAWSDGLVDPTVGRSLVALGYDRTFRLVSPEGPAVTVAVRAAPGWQHVHLEDDGVLVPRGTQLDLGATAKGLAADLAADSAAAVAAGVLVSLGGDLAVGGAPPDGGWPVLVSDTADPDAPRVGGQVVLLAWGGLATSGTAARRWRRGGTLVHHLIDPRTGAPTAGPWRTVSVLADSCLHANAASTAAVVRGADAPQWLRERGFSARLVHTDGTSTTTGDWPTEELS
jgi:thiamine biosynthesis lipoprotein ApbE